MPGLGLTGVSHVPSANNSYLLLNISLYGRQVSRDSDGMSVIGRWQIEGLLFVIVVMTGLADHGRTTTLVFAGVKE